MKSSLAFVQTIFYPHPLSSLVYRNLIYWSSNFFYIKKLVSKNNVCTAHYPIQERENDNGTSLVFFCFTLTIFFWHIANLTQCFSMLLCLIWTRKEKKNLSWNSIINNSREPALFHVIKISFFFYSWVGKK